MAGCAAIRFPSVATVPAAPYVPRGSPAITQACCWSARAAIPANRSSSAATEASCAAHHARRTLAHDHRGDDQQHDHPPILQHETDDEQRADQLPDETGHVKTS